MWKKPRNWLEHNIELNVINKSMLVVIPVLKAPTVGSQLVGIQTVKELDARLRTSGMTINSYVSLLMTTIIEDKKWLIN